MTFDNGNKPIGQVIGDLKTEFKDFAQTRLQMLKAEMQQKAALLKASIPMLLVAAIVGLFAFAVITFAFIAGLAPLFESKFNWLFASLIVGFVYLAVAGVVGWMGYRELTSQSLAPERTIAVLKQDQVWFSNEASNQSGRAA